MITFSVQNHAGLTFRVVEIIAGAISKIERAGQYFDVEEDYIIQTGEQIFKVV